VKNKQEGGFSLIEVVLAMVILALIVVPTCTSLVLSFRVNAKADAMMQAQLAVSSAVEQLMAVGIDKDRANDAIAKQQDYDMIFETKTDGAGETDAEDALPGDEQPEGEETATDEFPDVRITVEPIDGQDCYMVIVTDNDNLVEVVTRIRIGKVGGRE
jgi:prepilin-type N-terminal cleavage/methylation domain-containing protein